MSTFDGLNKVFGDEPSELQKAVEKSKSLRTDTPEAIAGTTQLKVKSIIITALRPDDLRKLII